MNKNSVFKGYGVEISLEKEEDFKIVMETLTRIGISSYKDNKLYQSCHILHKKRGEKHHYAIVHFKELFALDGKFYNLDKKDAARRNTIATLLEEWGLIKILDHDKIDYKIPINQLKIVPYKEKENWELIPKYQIGNKKENDNN